MVVCGIEKYIGLVFYVCGLFSSEPNDGNPPDQQGHFDLRCGRIHPDRSKRRYKMRELNDFEKQLPGSLVPRSNYFPPKFGFICLDDHGGAQCPYDRHDTEPSALKTISGVEIKGLIKDVPDQSTGDAGDSRSHGRCLELRSRFKEIDGVSNPPEDEFSGDSPSESEEDEESQSEYEDIQEEEFSIDSPSESEEYEETRHTSGRKKDSSRYYGVEERNRQHRKPQPPAPPPYSRNSIKFRRDRYSETESHRAPSGNNVRHEDHMDSYQPTSRSTKEKYIKRRLYEKERRKLKPLGVETEHQRQPGPSQSAEEEYIEKLRHEGIRRERRQSGVLPREQPKYWYDIPFLF